MHTDRKLDFLLAKALSDRVTSWESDCKVVLLRKAISLRYRVAPTR